VGLFEDVVGWRWGVLEIFCSGTAALVFFCAITVCSI
jgi:hypothetical protein